MRRQHVYIVAAFLEGDTTIERVFTTRKAANVYVKREKRVSPISTTFGVLKFGVQGTEAFAETKFLNHLVVVHE